MVSGDNCLRGPMGESPEHDYKCLTIYYTMCFLAQSYLPFPPWPSSCWN